MSYNPAIPQPNDLISQSQAQIQTNFAQANTIFGIDHVAFDDATAANRGKHDQSTYLEQAVDPTTLGNEAAFYSKDAGGVTELFFRREGNGTVIQMTDVGGNPTGTTEGMSFLPGGFIIKWGKQISMNNGAFRAYATGAFPTATLSLIVTPVPADTNTATVNDFIYSQQNPPVNGFTCTTVRRNSLTLNSPVTINYIAIGH